MNCCPMPAGKQQSLLLVVGTREQQLEQSRKLSIFSQWRNHVIINNATLKKLISKGFLKPAAMEKEIQCFSFLQQIGITSQSFLLISRDTSHVANSRDKKYLEFRTCKNSFKLQIEIDLRLKNFQCCQTRWAPSVCSTPVLARRKRDVLNFHSNGKERSSHREILLKGKDKTKQVDQLLRSHLITKYPARTQASTSTWRCACQIC